MKKILFVILFLPCFAWSNQTLTLDERCFGFSEFIVEIIKNKYKGETLDEQLNLLNEIDDNQFRELTIRLTKDMVYNLPIQRNQKDIDFQIMTQMFAVYRTCIINNS